MTVEIPLKQKYLRSHKGRYKGGASSGGTPRKRKKLSDVQKRALPEQPKRALWVQASGRKKMITL